MKLLIISPPFGAGGKKHPMAPVAPPALEYLAALTRQIRPDIEIELVDANLEDFNPSRAEADLVAFSVYTVQAPWAYKTAAIFKQGGVPVVMGGFHVTALPEEALQYADAVVVGEAEAVWSDLLVDFDRGQLQRVYHSKPLPLEGLPHPQKGLLKSSYRLGSFFTARGCPHQCSFCAVSQFFGRKVRLRPIPEVAEELAGSQNKTLWNLDDNCWGFNLDRSIELYREISHNVKGKSWFGMGDLASLENSRSPELLKWAQRSGLTFVRVGWESDNPGTLEHFKAKSKQGNRRLDSIKKIRAAGIDVMLFVIVGSRSDDMGELESLIRLSEELKVTLRPIMLTPLPGTDLYKQYRPYLFEGYDWDRYDGFQAVFDHPTMSPEARESGLVELWQRTYTLPKILHRLTRIGVKGFPKSHAASFMIQFNESRHFRNLPKKT